MNEIMKSGLKPRPEAYQLYWKFAYERQNIFNARLATIPESEWTTDPIFKAYKFCNTFRALDRVSQYLIREVCYGNDNNNSNDRLFQIVLFRLFSNIDTWKVIKQELGRMPIINDLTDDSLKKALDLAKKRNGKLYTHAFILCATDAYGQGKKHLNHLELLKDMFIKNRLGNKLLSAKSLKEIYELLHTFPLMGDFMSYQIAIDLNYSECINFSENEFTVAGPGAKRGIKKVFCNTGDLSNEDIIMWMVKHQDEEFSRLGYDFKGLFGRKLHAIDCQSLFCETDKYCRVALPNLESSRSNIKSKFSKSNEPLPLFFPPKWNIHFKSELK